MIIAILVVWALSVAGAAVGTALLYERIVQRSTANFAVTPKTTPLEDLTSHPEPVFTDQEFKAMFLNEDEEDIKHMLDTGKITAEQIPDVLDALGISNEIHFS